LDITELSQKLFDLEGNLSAHDSNLAIDIAYIQSSVDNFKTETEGKLEKINDTLDEMNKMQDILDDLVELDMALTQGNEELQQSIDEIPKEEEPKEGFGLVEGLLIVVIILLIVNLLALLLLRKSESKETEAPPGEESELGRMDVEEEEE
jgi:hypothetical protein